MQSEIFRESSDKFSASSFDLGCYDVNREAAKQANEMMSPVYNDLIDQIASMANQVQIVVVQLDLLKKKLSKLKK